MLPGWGGGQALGKRDNILRWAWQEQGPGRELTFMAWVACKMRG